MDLATIQEILNSALTPFFALIGGGLGVGGWFSIKTKTKARIAITERTQLSRDQYQLIADMREMMSEQKKETQLLREEIKNLQKVNLELTRENAELSVRITELNNRLDNERQQQIQINVKGEI